MTRRELIAAVAGAAAAPVDAPAVRAVEIPPAPASARIDFDHDALTWEPPPINTRCVYVTVDGHLMGAED